MKATEQASTWWRQTATPLNFIVIGAGIAGLSVAIGLRRVGHNVTILEQSMQMSEVGAGIQVPANASRVLERLGILDEILEKSTLLSKISTRRYANDEELIATSFDSQRERYGWPLCSIYRGDLQQAMLKRVNESGVKVVLGQKVIGIDDQFGARVQVSSGQWYNGDVVIAADGIKSKVRAQMVKAHGVIDASIPTGDAAYRIIIPRERLLDEPEALQMLNDNVAVRWVGPDGHIIAYPVSPKKNKVTGKMEKTLLNMALLHRRISQTPAEESWTELGSKEEMLDFYQSWAPIIQTLMSHVPDGEVVEWSLNTHTPLPSWVEGSVALMGDACHPQLPYLAQGAAQCLEDTGVLAECFSHTSDVQLALAVYELVRKDRAETIQSSTLDTRIAIHMHDGPEQQARDDKWRGLSDVLVKDRLSDTGFQDFMYGVDVMRETRERWADLVKSVTTQS